MMTQNSNPAELRILALGENIINLGGLKRLDEFLNSIKELRLSARRRIVEQALILIEQLYANLPQKEALHAAEPLRRLQLLRTRLEQESEDPLTVAPCRSSLTPEDPRTTALAFHYEVNSIFASVRDLHLTYSLPGLFDSRRAVLGIDVEACFEERDGVRRRQYIVSRVVDDLRQQGLKAGGEVLAWNGVPIARAVALNAAHHAGSNPAARHARGLTRLAIRPLRESLPPDEDRVIMTYKPTPSARPVDVHLEWFVGLSDPPFVEEDQDLGTESDVGLDFEGDAVRHARRVLFVGDLDSGGSADTGSAVVDPRGKEVTAQRTIFGAWRSIFRAWCVEDPNGEDKQRKYGYLRIYSFDIPRSKIDTCLDLLEQLLQALPQQGLILDVRENAGGSIWLAERLLQFFGPGPIEPEGFQLRNTPAAFELVSLNSGSETFTCGPDLGPWRESLQQARETGTAYSAAFPISDREACNARGQKYYGSVVLITNALSYSATDIFAAGFQDHGLGKVLGVDDATGGGGANVLEHERLRELLRGGSLKRLPRGTLLRVALRRALRVGKNPGAVLEDFGVRPDVRHFVTYDDLRQHNKDLIARAIHLLKKGPPERRIDVRCTKVDDRLQLEVTVKNLSHVDVYVDGRPHCSSPTEGAAVTIDGFPPNAQSVRLEGFSGKNGPLASRRVTLDSCAG